MVRGALMNKSFSKEIRRSITGSLSRFIAIFAIVALGAGFFAGLRNSAPVMRKTTDKYFDDNNIYDIQLISTMGFTDEDIRAIQNVENCENILPTYTIDALSKINNKDKVIRLHTLSDEINKVEVVTGRLPTAPGECVLPDDKFLPLDLKLGDTITLEDKDGKLKDNVKTAEYKIVGTVRTPYYLSISYGSSTIGNGSVELYMYVMPENFCQEVYTDVYLTVKGAKELSAFSDQYKEKVNLVKDSIENLAKDRTKIRYDEVMGDARKELDDAQDELNSKKDDTIKEFDKAYNQIQNGKAEISKNEKKLQDGKKDYEDGITQLEKSRKEFDEKINSAENDIVKNQALLTQGKEKLNASKKQLDDLKVQMDELSKAIKKLQAMGQDVTELEYKYSIMAGAYQNGLLEFKKGQNELVSKEKLLESGKKKLAEEKEAGLFKFKTAEKDLEKAKIDIAKGEKELKNAKSTLKTSENEYYTKKEDAFNKINDGQKEIDDNKEKLSDIKEPEWFVLDRNANVGFVSMSQDSDRMDSIATVFPIIFFLVSALVALTTMTRMVEEERILIGTYKALGYSKGKIMSKYIIYAALASILGSILGIFIGFLILPNVIWNAYGIIYKAPPASFDFSIPYALLSCALSVFFTLGATLWASWDTLKESPAKLMQPKAPKKGKRILLEKITPIWSRMKFTHKVTARNIFRYKKRMFMTIIGIAGCTSLLVTAFGLRDSISIIVPNQFEKIYQYTLTVDAKEEEVTGELLSVMENKDYIEDYLSIYQKSTSLYKDSEKKDIFVIVPKDTARLKDFIKLSDRISQKDIEFNENSVIITEKIAAQLELQVGDSIELENTDKSRSSYKITAICENYVNSYIYIAPQIFTEDIEFKTKFCKTPISDEKDQKVLSDVIQDTDMVNTVSFSDVLINHFDDMIKALNIVIVILTFSAGMLAFIVLYNLTNINVTERQRELATIKVLGFYDNEVSSYIYRETALLTLMGCLLGMIGGVLLHQFVIKTVEVDMVMFGRIINPLSFLWSFLLTMAFYIIVNLVISRKLKKIDMVSSLKSVD